MYQYQNISNDFFNKKNDYEVVKNNKNEECYNIAISFDIETSSFIKNGEKCSIMYLWNLSIDGNVFTGRTWEEFYYLYADMVKFFKLTETRKIIIYIHNLSYEFQFLRKRLKWKKIFSIEERKPLYAITSENIEFRCSYLLSGKSLELLGRDYTISKKLVGNLDYNLIRHSTTPLTEKELQYGYNDVNIVVEYIKDRIKTDGNILRMPLTKTGYVRNFCRNACLYRNIETGKKEYYKFEKYHNLIKTMTLNEIEYTQVKRAFSGGFTHANAFNSNKIFKNVGCFDFTSSYPAVMVAEKFPMSPPEHVTINNQKDFEKNIKNYCCIFDIEFFNIEAITIIDNIISVSKCISYKNVVEDNGRIVTADYIKITITEQDYFMIQKFYTWGKKGISNFMRFIKNYLPKDFIYAVLKLYEDKTTLKGVIGEENEYLLKKEMLNSCYGMCVTDICRESIIYENDEWKKEKTNIETELNKYNNSPRRFLYYLWGIYVTAYARKNLFNGILEFGSDFIYSDTDSIKAINIENHKEYIKNYNMWIIEKLEKACKYHDIDIKMIKPKSVDGKEKPLGVWDYEGTYQLFSTLGAKRYLGMKDYKIELTVSGINKKIAVPYLVNKYGKYGIFRIFDDNLTIPKEYSGKNIHTYIDYPISGKITDYLGNVSDYEELSGVHLDTAEYTLSLSRNYINYLLGIREEETRA